MIRKKKKQSPGRNADTQFMNKLWRDNERAKEARSREIRDREKRARERLKTELRAVIGAHT